MSSTGMGAGGGVPWVAAVRTTMAGAAVHAPPKGVRGGARGGARAPTACLAAGGARVAPTACDPALGLELDPQISPRVRLGGALVWSLAPSRRHHRVTVTGGGIFRFTPSLTYCKLLERGACVRHVTRVGSEGVNRKIPPPVTVTR
jgi:hypothetical protein